MSKILIVEDQLSKARHRMEALAAKDYEVAVVCQEDFADCLNGVKYHLGLGRWDVLVLDMCLPLGDHWAGINLYNWLNHSSFRNQWDHTIITTMYAPGGDIRKCTDGEAFILRIFAETAGVSAENVLPATHGRDGKTAVELLVDRIDHLLKHVIIGRCLTCGERQP